MIVSHWLNSTPDIDGRDDAILAFGFGTNNNHEMVSSWYIDQKRAATHVISINEADQKLRYVHILAKCEEVQCRQIIVNSVTIYSEAMADIDLMKIPSGSEVYS